MREAKSSQKAALVCRETCNRALPSYQRKSNL